MAKDKLAAVNSCLRGIGVQAVSSLDDPNIDAGLAERVIDNVLTDTLAQGWWFNREPNWDLALGHNNEIKVPNNALDIVTADTSRPEQVTMRGDKLYDILNHTHDMSAVVDKKGHLNCTFIITMEFDDIPSVAQRYITYRSRRLFAQDLEMDNVRWQIQEGDEREAYIQLQRSDARQRKHNYSNNPAIASFMSRVGGRYRDRGANMFGRY